MHSSTIKYRYHVPKQPVESASTSKDNQELENSAKPQSLFRKGIEAAKAASNQPKGYRAMLSALVESKHLPKSATVTFKDMFPGTTLPHVNLVNGQPRIDRSIYNDVLTSHLRKCKKILVIPSKTQLPKELVAHIRHLMDKALVSELKSKIDNKGSTKGKNTPQPATQAVKGGKKGSSRLSRQKQKTVEFISATPAPPVNSNPQPSNTFEVLEPIESIQALLDPNSLSHLTLSESKVAWNVIHDVPLYNPNLPEHVSKINKIGTHLMMHLAPPRLTLNSPQHAVETFESLKLELTPHLSPSRYIELFCDNKFTWPVSFDSNRIDDENLNLLRNLETPTFKTIASLKHLSVLADSLFSSLPLLSPNYHAFSPSYSGLPRPTGSGRTDQFCLLCKK